MSLSTFHILICFFLFLDYFSYQERYLKIFFTSQKIPSWVKSSRKRIQKHIKEKKHQEFLLSIITGEKRRFRRMKEYQFFKNSQSLHLLTPSGLHLTAFLAPFFLIFRRNLYQWLILTFAGVFLFTQAQFASAKRVFLLKVLYKMKIPSLFAFYFCFGCALPFQKNLSWLYSFLFIGVILLRREYKTLPIIYDLFLAQIMTLIFWDEAYYPLSFIINPMMTFAISSLFPFLLLSFFIPQFYFIIKPLINLSFYFSSKVSLIPPLFPSHIFTLFIFILLKEIFLRILRSSRKNKDLLE